MQVIVSIEMPSFSLHPNDDLRVLLTVVVTIYVTGCIVQSLCLCLSGKSYLGQAVWDELSGRVVWFPAVIAVPQTVWDALLRTSFLG